MLCHARYISAAGVPMQGSTRLLVTHQRQHLPACERIIVLRDGRITADGTYAELQVSFQSPDKQGCSLNSQQVQDWQDRCMVINAPQPSAPLAINTPAETRAEGICNGGLMGGEVLGN